MTDAYKEAGVDVQAGYESVERIKKHVARTKQLGVMGSLGGFAGLFDLGSLQYRHPVLLSGTDGVGTKLLLAIQQKKYDTIGIDCVAMCVNDIVAQGGKPLFFLDYIAVGKNDPNVIEQIVSGVAKGCVAAGAALIGGETAEMPDMYQAEDFDLAGFAVGVVEKDEIIDTSSIQAGDILIGIISNGIHSNGFSLVRKIFFKDHSYQLSDTFEELDGRELGDVLLDPTRIYVNDILALHQARIIKGAAHITGGGLIENIPRMLPKQLAAAIQLDSWPILPIFKLMQRIGQLSQADLLGTFNLGIGMVVAVSADRVGEALNILCETETPAYVIGKIVDRYNYTVSSTKNEVLL